MENAVPEAKAVPDDELARRLAMLSATPSAHPARTILGRDLIRDMTTSLLAKVAGEAPSGPQEIRKIGLQMLEAIDVSGIPHPRTQDALKTMEKSPPTDQASAIELGILLSIVTNEDLKNLLKEYDVSEPPRIDDLVSILLTGFSNEADDFAPKEVRELSVPREAMLEVAALEPWLRDLADWARIWQTLEKRSPSGSEGVPQAKENMLARLRTISLLLSHSHAYALETLKLSVSAFVRAIQNKDGQRTPLTGNGAMSWAEGLLQGFRLGLRESLNRPSERGDKPPFVPKAQEEKSQDDLRFLEAVALESLLRHAEMHATLLVHQRRQSPGSKDPTQAQCRKEMMVQVISLQAVLSKAPSASWEALRQRTDEINQGISQNRWVDVSDLFQKARLGVLQEIRSLQGSHGPLHIAQIPHGSTIH